MTILVQKYGGSSVADVEKIGRVADKVVAAKRRGHDVVVVVSAMGKTTDQLLGLAKQVSDNPPRRELDMLLTTGERVTMALLSIAIAARGEGAISFTGSQSGILTNDRHFDARIIEVRPHRIEDELARGNIVIVAGYQGMSYKREITTLGRGGSDTTAIALAAALGAERCEIYSDVDGVYSADPKAVSDPVHLPTLDLAVLQEMAEAGAKVLNAQAVEWARRAKIAIYARKTSDAWEDPNAAPKQTIATEDPTNRARAVVGFDRVATLAFDSRDSRAVLEATSDLELPIVDFAASGGDASCAVPLLNVPDWDSKRAKLEARVGSRIVIEAGRSIVSVVGDGMMQSGLCARFMAVMDEAGIVPWSVFAGPLRMAATVDAARCVDAQRALHASFV